MIQKIKNWIKRLFLYLRRDDVKEIEKQVRLITKDPYEWE